MEQADARDPIRIIDTAKDSLMLGNRGVHWTEPWSAVQQVAVAGVPFGDSPILIAMLSIDGIEGERTILTSEVDANWHQILCDLPRALTGIEAFEVWSRRSDIGSRVAVIYNRRGGE